MSEAAKIKAGIPSTKRRSKKQTKDEQIRELQARLATLEHPDEMAAVSREPLVSRRRGLGSPNHISPPLSF
jgi:adenosylmethionine-8-amino-7-oxononanoate aminotransferase